MMSRPIVISLELPGYPIVYMNTIDLHYNPLSGSPSLWTTGGLTIMQVKRIFKFQIRRALGNDRNAGVRFSGY